MNRLSDRMLHAIQAAGTNQARLAKACGTQPTTIRDIVVKQTEPRFRLLFKIAEALNVSPLWLAKGEGRMRLEKPSETLPRGELFVVPVKGVCSAGRWAEAPATSDVSTEELMIPEQRYSELFGLTVSGDSMDKIYADGTILICCPLSIYTSQVRDGDHVIAQRACAGEYETTVKVISKDLAGRVWLVPESTNASHQAVLAADASAETVEIIAIVVGAYSRR